MRTDILFKNMKRSEYIETFVGDKIENLVERLAGPDNDTHITVRLSQSKERTFTRQPVFKCEILVKSGMTSRFHKVEKADRNIFRCIATSVESMKSRLGKSHDRLRNDRRRRRVPEISADSLAQLSIEPLEY